MVGEARQSVMCTVPKLNLFFPILGGGRGENATIAALIYYPSVLYLKKVKGRKKQTEGIEKAVQKW